MVVDDLTPMLVSLSKLEWYGRIWSLGNNVSRHHEKSV
jgi:hypothetical protein